MSVTPPEMLMVAPAEAARIAGVSRASIYAAMSAKPPQILGRKFGKRTLISVESIRAWLDSLPVYESKTAA